MHLGPLRLLTTALPLPPWSCHSRGRYPGASEVAVLAALVGLGLEVLDLQVLFGEIIRLLNHVLALTCHAMICYVGLGLEVLHLQMRGSNRYKDHGQLQPIVGPCTAKRSRFVTGAQQRSSGVHE